MGRNSSGIFPRLFEGKMNREGRALIRLADNFHGSTMGLDHGLHQTQAESQARFVPAFIAAVQAVPDSRKVLRANAHAGGFDRDDCFSVRLASDLFDLPSL